MTQQTTGNRQEASIECGDHVRIKGNAKGTVWETGWVIDIDEIGYLIRYGSNDCFGLYGVSGRKQVNELIRMDA